MSRLRLIPLALITVLLTASEAWAEKHWVRLDFEDLGELEHLTEQYAAHGIHFQATGDDGTQSFVNLSVPPFGQVVWNSFPPLGLNQIAPSFYGDDFLLNTRVIDFDQVQSRVIFDVFSSGIVMPPSLWAQLKAWDQPGGTGTEIYYEAVPQVSAGTVDIEVPNIRSVTIQNADGYVGFDDLVFDAGTAPRGGNLDIPASPGAQVFLDGNPGYLGNPDGDSPQYLLSVPTGKHTVSVYSPGYEWHQETVDVVLGQDTVINADLVPVTVPLFDGTIALETTSGPIDVGDHASPYPVDWNGDALVDLVVGDSSGAVDVYLNTTTNEAPLYAAATNVLAPMGTNASPFVVDYFEDGLNDLVVGYGDGTVKVSVHEDTMPFSGSFDPNLVVVPGGDAVPFMVDFDNDGRKDLLAGSSDGNVYLYLNQRLDASPSFSSGSATVIASVTSNAAPTAVLDWDGDGAKDLVVGEGDGTLNLFLNEGSDESPSYSSSSKLTMDDSSTLDVGDFARPIVADVNIDHFKDILVGNNVGEILLLAGGPPFVLGDVNGDGVLDEGDIHPFLDVLLNGPYESRADMNGDEVLDGLDVAGFVATVQSGGSAQVVPEPGTAWLIAVGLLGLVAHTWRRRGQAV